MNLAGAGLLALFLSACAALPPLQSRVASNYLTGTDATRLGAAIAPLRVEHPELSGIATLSEGRDAFSARAMLAAAADRTLDVQYYIWHGDTTGTLLFDALRAAAARGVRVRLLLDDNNTAGLDGALAALDADPLIEVRLFNPFSMRGARMLGYLGDFSRLNRRMHNKSFTADNQATIVGGRNIGDEYFGAAGDVLFADLDVLAVGPVVDAVSRDFDRYWNSESSYPVSLLAVAASAAQVAEAGAAAARNAQTPAARDYLKAMRESPFVARLVARTLPLTWATARLLSDDPDKVLRDVPEASKVASQLTEAMGKPVSHLDLVSPYFVPGATWSTRFAGIARTGVEVFILTNSLEATDVAAVHAGYARWRVPMLQAGVQLYELRRAGEASEADSGAPGSASRGRPPGSGMSGGSRSGHSTSGSSASGNHTAGSSAASLHAKTFAVDGQRLFVGSFNFDPRSAELNTEMGLLIESPDMARQLSTALRERVPARAYKVSVDAKGALHWTEQTPGGPRVHDTEPGTGFWRRAAVGLLSLLPIDWML